MENDSDNDEFSVEPYMFEPELSELGRIRKDRKRLGREDSERGMNPSRPTVSLYSV